MVDLQMQIPLKKISLQIGPLPLTIDTFFCDKAANDIKVKKNKNKSPFNKGDFRLHCSFAANLNPLCKHTFVFYPTHEKYNV